MLLFLFGAGPVLLAALLLSLVLVGLTFRDTAGRLEIAHELLDIEPTTKLHGRRALLALCPPLYAALIQAELNRAWQRFGEEPDADDAGRRRSRKMALAAFVLVAALALLSAVVLSEDDAQPRSGPSASTIRVGKVKHLEIGLSEMQVRKRLGRPAAVVTSRRGGSHAGLHCLVYRDRSTFDTGRAWYVCFAEGGVVAPYWAAAPGRVLEP